MIYYYQRLQCISNLLFFNNLKKVLPTPVVATGALKNNIIILVNRLTLLPDQYINHHL